MPSMWQMHHRWTASLRQMASLRRSLRQLHNPPMDMQRQLPQLHQVTCLSTLEQQQLKHSSTVCQVLVNCS